MTHPGEYQSTQFGASLVRMSLHAVASFRSLFVGIFTIAVLSWSVRGSSEPGLEDLWGSDVSISFVFNRCNHR